MRHPPILPVATLASAILALAGCLAEPIPSPPISTPAAAVPASSPGRASPLSVAARPAEAPPPSPEPTPSLGRFDLLTCGAGFTFPNAAFARPPGDELGPDPAAAGLRKYIDGRSATEPGVPKRGWRVVKREPGVVTYVAGAGEHAEVAVMKAGALDTWEFSEGGECHLSVVLPDGIGFARWRLDPAHPPKAVARAVSVLGSELACASGRAPGRRVRAPILVETGKSVVIGLIVTTNPNADCQGNPEFRSEIPLAAALGTRALFDGSAFPPAPRS